MARARGCGEGHEAGLATWKEGACVFELAPVASFAFQQYYAAFGHVGCHRGTPVVNTYDQAGGACLQHPRWELKIRQTSLLSKL